MVPRSNRPLILILPRRRTGPQVERDAKCTQDFISTCSEYVHVSELKFRLNRLRRYLPQTPVWNYPSGRHGMKKR
ncbi:hypothetical protein CEXT_237521 [Caerostris extrusa]|uniref:Uncharacterized protein n=1 Tax=Caerostris extrusa TaxID=172846 RepID=A0AAV4Y775_CAEEX|nr:hypothetical protein CEXT_237521 [Caerostris extrusa]